MVGYKKKKQGYTAAQMSDRDVRSARQHEPQEKTAREIKIREREESKIRLSMDFFSFYFFFYFVYSVFVVR